MSLKEFIIFIIIFTIVYILFFIIYDKIINKTENKKLNDKAKNSIKLENYIEFSKFYGIESKMTINNLLSIFSDYKTIGISDFNLEEIAKKNVCDKYEIAVVISYFEYIGLFKRNTILLTTNSIIENPMVEQTLISKYYTLLSNKSDIETIKKTIGESYYSDLTTINEKFLFPGVRFIDQNIYYYVGDKNE